MNESNPEDELGSFIRQLESALSGHGYGFQYAALREARRVRDGGWSPWELFCAELPVQVQGVDTRVDFVLKHCREPWFLVVECKRSNPAFQDWCFVGTPSDVRCLPGRSAVVEKLGRLPDGRLVAQSERWDGVERESFIAYEVKSKAKGDANGKGRGVIEEAVAQVLRGSNGVVQWAASHKTIIAESPQWFFAPVLVTTARLWHCTADLSTSDLKTGLIELRGSDAKPVPWVTYHYHQSLSLRHTLQSWASPVSVAALVEGYAKRSVFVVSADGLENFLTSFGPKYLP